MEEETKRYYKLEVGDVVTVHRKDGEKNTYYSICFKKKDASKNEIYLYKKIKFKQGVDIPDKTRIRVLDFFEDGYMPKNSYDTIWTVFIQDYEIVENEIKEYQEKKKELEEEASGYEITEESLPF